MKNYLWNAEKIARDGEADEGGRDVKSDAK